MSPLDISLDQLKEAVSIKEEISKLEARLNTILSKGSGGSKLPSPFVAAPKAKKKGKRVMSESAKTKLIAAENKRWMKIKTAKWPIL